MFVEKTTCGVTGSGIVYFAVASQISYKDVQRSSHSEQCVEEATSMIPAYYHVIHSIDGFLVKALLVIEHGGRVVETFTHSAHQTLVLSHIPHDELVLRR